MLGPDQISLLCMRQHGKANSNKALRTFSKQCLNCKELHFESVSKQCLNCKEQHLKSGSASAIKVHVKCMVVLTQTAAPSIGASFSSVQTNGMLQTSACICSHSSLFVEPPAMLILCGRAPVM